MSSTKIIVEEVLRKEIEVDGGLSLEEAKDQVSGRYYKSEIILSDELHETNFLTEEELNEKDAVLSDIAYLKKPLTKEEVVSKMDNDYYISGIVAVKDHELFYNNDYDHLIDLLRGKLSEIHLDNIQYKMVKVIPEDSIILYKVCGDVFDSTI